MDHNDTLNLKKRDLDRASQVLYSLSLDTDVKRTLFWQLKIFVMQWRIS